MTPGPRLPHVPALDGLRGVAVVGVLAFHLGHLRGGFLGVDLFFVLSGFLITSLLLVEREGSGRIDLRAFWARRARRLLPALFVLLAAVALYAATRPAGLAMAGLRGDALATLGYVANWHSIVADHGYWDLFAAPSLLAHTWSLAIEEQLYIVWPLVVAVALRFGRRALLVTSLALGSASALAMIVLHGAGDDTSRVYFGTDTRAAAVLAGAALAAWGGTRLRAARLVGPLAAVALALAWFRVPGTSNGLYEGGFLLCSVAGALVVAGALQPGPLSRALSLAPLRHLGAISYGVYLWHWPVFVVLTPDRAGVHGWPLLVVKLAVTLAISEASYRLLELPIRRGSLRGWRIRIAAPVAAGAAFVAVIAGTAAPAPASIDEPAAAPPVVAPAAPVTPGVTRVLVVGDSGAKFLGDGMARVAADDVEVRNAGTIACGLVTAGGRLRLDGGGYAPDPDWCAGWPQRWQMELGAFHPDVALLVIGWPGLGDREVDGAWRHPCDPRFDDYYASEVRHAIGVLSSTGARVVVADSPYLTLPVVQHDHVQRVDCLNAIYRREAKAAGATVLPLGEWLCPDARHCRIEDDGVTLRTDGIHFRDAGADIAGRWALAEIEQQQDAEHREGGG
jgi:peptidoglycan/LPS O-acetylase OafA/YrhL